MSDVIVVRKMTCFKIGDGFSINVWDDLWIKSLLDIVSLRRNRVDGRTLTQVGELKDVYDNRWNEMIVFEFF